VTKLGRPTKYAKARTATAIRLPPEMHERLRDAADERDVAMNFLVIKAIGEFLERLIPVDEIRWTRSPEEATTTN
jgi:predicted transcriptional regulator